MKNITKHHLKEAAAGLTLLAMTAVFAVWIGSLAANATEEPDAALCVPVYETQDNPDYVPEQTIEHEAVFETTEHPAVFETVEHEAVYETVEHAAEYEYIEHDATYATEYQYVKQVKGKVQKKSIFGWKNEGHFGWETWTGGSTQWSEDDVAVLESGAHNAVQDSWTEGSWPFKSEWRKVSTDYRYAPTGETRQGDLIKDAWTEKVLVKEAWTEDVLITEAWSEEVLVTEAWTETITVEGAWTETVPAQGEPTIEVQVGEECPATPEPVVTPTPEVTPGPETDEFTIVSGAGAPAPAAVAVEAEATFTG